MAMKYVFCVTIAAMLASSVGSAETFKYGIYGGKVSGRVIAKAPVNCSWQGLGVRDPAPGQVKTCFINGRRMAVDGQTFEVTTTVNVDYGLDDRFVTKNLAGAAAYTCGNALFGDPAPNYPRACSQIQTTH